LRDELFACCQETEPTFRDMSDEHKLQFILGSPLMAKNSAKMLSEFLKRRRCMVFSE
jgi:hypothetical protein